MLKSRDFKSGASLTASMTEHWKKRCVICLHNNLDHSIRFVKVEVDIVEALNKQQSIVNVQVRAVVERSIGAMKDFKLLLNVEFISQIEVTELHKILTVVAALVNFNLDVRKTSY